MNSSLSQLIDWWTLRFAAFRASRQAETDPHVEEARNLLQSPNFFGEGTPAAAVTFTGGKNFQFPSPVRSGFAENDLVKGRISRCGKHWRQKSAVILLHGWSDRFGYRYRFPWLARCFNRRGVNSVMFELPCHYQRRPRGAGSIGNFISRDLGRTALVTHQALAEIHAMVGWLLAQGCPRVSLIGFSMGGWLAGLAACHDSRIACAALITPVSRMDLLVRDSVICEPIRRALKDKPLDLTRLNLQSQKPLLSRGYTLLVGAEHDAFVPPKTIEELWVAWGKPEHWNLPYGHISILASSSAMKRVAQWVALRLKIPAGASDDLLRVTAVPAPVQPTQFSGMRLDT